MKYCTRVKSGENFIIIFVSDMGGAKWLGKPPLHSEEKLRPRAGFHIVVWNLVHVCNMQIHGSDRPMSQSQQKDRHFEFWHSFDHFQLLYFRELLLGVLSDELHIWSV